MTYISRAKLRKIISETIDDVDETTPRSMRKILDAAYYGDRIVANGKTIWSGLGNRAGLHSYADKLIGEKWAKSGKRFTNKVKSLPSGTQIEIRQFHNINRSRGRWKTIDSFTI